MIRFQKSWAAPKKRASVVEFATFRGGVNHAVDPSVLPLKYAETLYNYATKDGALKDGLGVAAAYGPLETDALGVWQYRRFDGEKEERDDRLIVYCADGYLYQCSLNATEGAHSGFTRLAGSAFTAPPVCVNYRLNSEDVLIACSEKDEMLVYDGVNPPYRVKDSPHISSMALHYERLFAVAGAEKNTVWFSDDLDPTAWDVNLNGAGFVAMDDYRGRLLRVESFSDYLYVFRQYGITRMTAYADQTQFSLSHLFVGSGKINGNTVAVCGDRVLFLASDGLFCFDGVSTVKILPQISGCIGRTDSAAACYHDGKYYLAARFDFGDNRAVGCEDGEYLNNALIEYEVAGGNVHLLRGVDISFLASVAGAEDVLYMTVRGESSNTVARMTHDGRIFGRPSEKLWVSPFSDLGRPDKIKELKELNVRTEKPLTVTVRTEYGVRSYELSGGEGISRVKMSDRGKLVSIAFESRTTDCRISHPTLLLYS